MLEKNMAKLLAEAVKEHFNLKARFTFAVDEVLNNQISLDLKKYSIK